MLKKIQSILLKSGINKADYVYIYSDFRPFFKFCKKNPKKLVKLFLEFFTKRGITCVIPSFSYTTSDKFIVEKTKSKVGFLANFVISNLKHERSEHPLFSFVSIGKNSKIVQKVGKSAFGKRSLHARLYAKNCYFLYFFRPLKDGNTLVHHIEQMFKANYRFEKKFSTKVYNGKKYIGKNYSAYLKKNINDKKYFFNFKKVLKKLINKKYIKINDFKKSQIVIIKYDNFYNDLKKLYEFDNKIFINHK